MGRRLAALTLDTLPDLPDPCRRCVVREQLGQGLAVGALRQRGRIEPRLPAEAVDDEVAVHGARAQERGDVTADGSEDDARDDQADQPHATLPGTGGKTARDAESL